MTLQKIKISIPDLIPILDVCTYWGQYKIEWTLTDELYELTERQQEKYWEFFDLDAYRDDIEKAIKSTAPRIADSGEFKITFSDITHHCPRQYNYVGDWINCTVEFDYDKIMTFINENLSEFSEHINSKRYRSCDGFNSAMTNDLDEWFEDIEYDPHSLTYIRAVSQALTFIIERENLFENWNTEAYEYFAEHMDIMRYTNYNPYSFDELEELMTAYIEEIKSENDAEYLMLILNICAFYSIMSHQTRFEHWFDIIDIDENESAICFVERIRDIEQISDMIRTAGRDVLEMAKTIGCHPKHSRFRFDLEKYVKETQGKTDEIL